MRFGDDPVAVMVGTPDLSKPVPVRIHSACLTGDVFGSRRCDCGDQLRLALARLQEAGGGIILVSGPGRPRRRPRQQDADLQAARTPASTPSTPTPRSVSTTTSAITAWRCACCKCSAARASCC
jgi:hypothetical protein